MVGHRKAKLTYVVDTRSTSGLNQAGKRLTCLNNGYNDQGAPLHYFPASGSTATGGGEGERGETRMSGNDLQR